MSSVHFSSQSGEWSTPQAFFDKYNALYSFTLDPCATPANAKCAKFYTIADDGLSQDWSGHVVWLNPPYGREIGLWMKKAYESAQKGALVVCLVPARTDTNWFHEYAIKGQINFVKGRLKFSGHAHAAPFPSAVVVFLPPNKYQFHEV